MSVHILAFSQASERIIRVHSKRYPVKRHVFMQKVGRLLPHRIGQILEELGYTNRYGFKVWINPNQGNDVDLKVWSNNDLILIGEILNWSTGSRLSEKRCNNIICNLSKHHCRKILIYTVLDRKNWLKVHRNKIDTLKIGYQILPQTFYWFYKYRGQTTKRMTDCKDTKKDIKSKISRYLENKNLHVSTYK